MMDNELENRLASDIDHADFATEAPPDASVDRDESRIIFQTKSVNMQVAALSNAFEDARFHIGGLDDPRIITPLGAEVTMTIQNQDELHPHGWKLIKETPPFAHPEIAASAPPAFPGAEITHIAPHHQETIHFTVDQPGVYTYLCPDLSDNDVGLYGIWEVAPGH
ncbi:hypothetical protein [Sulfobacillus thermosulfidooxidans]|nr:hypothetical protein [Sulfobacillus thermosulfidooxidans]